MQDIGQSWIWIVIAVAILAFFFLRRGRRSHSGLGDGGLGHGGHGHHGHHERDDEDRTRPASTQPIEAAIDPVSGSAIPTAGAITSVYQGKAYYFASKENRDRFEAAPQDFAGKAQGVAMGGGESAERPRHRHHGC